MRLWSIHPKYPDSAGLVALWREGLPAKAVLLKKTKGYRNHPQLTRFKNSKNPEITINNYLYFIYKEAESRGFKFNKGKLDKKTRISKINVTEGQIRFEISYLKNKLKYRNRNFYLNIKTVKEPQPHPIFRTIKGEKERWEKGK